MDRSPVFEHPCRILIADDEAEARKHIRELLEDQLGRHIPVEIEESADLSNVKQKLKKALPEQPFDVLVLDWKFGTRSNGKSLLVWLKREALEIDTEVIMLTGHPQTELQEEVLEMGAYFYADKESVLYPDKPPEAPDGSGSFLSPRAFVFLIKNCAERLRVRRLRGKLIDLIGQMHKRLTNSLDLDEHLRIVAEMPQKINDKIHKVSIRMPSLEPERGVTLLEAVARVDCQQCAAKDPHHGAANVALVETEGITGHVYRTGEYYLCNKGIAADPYYKETCPHTKAQLAVPLKLGSRVIGVLSLASTEQGAFGSEDVRAMLSVAEVASPSIRNALIFGTILQMATQIVNTVANSHKRLKVDLVRAFDSLRLEQVRPLFKLVLESA